MIVYNLYNNFFNYVTYTLDWPQCSTTDMIKIHPCNGLHTCKMEYEDDSESKIIQLVK